MLGTKITILFALLSVQFIGSTAFGAQSCPIGWNLNMTSGLCYPDLPSTDYFRASGDPYERAVCGPGRIPVTSSFEPLKISTSGIPNSSMNFAATANYYGVPTAKSSDASYLYQSLPRCVCMNGDAPAPSPSPSPIDETSGRFTGGNYPVGFTRIYPDTYDVINTQNQSGTVKYNLVAYTDDIAVEGRAGETFKNPGIARCGCPNINEEPKQNSSPVAGEIVGWHCESKLAAPQPNGTGYGRILTTYNPTYHGPTSSTLDVVMGAQVDDPNDDSVSGTSATAQILIPTASGGTQNYSRKIWTCAPPYLTNFGSKSCSPPPNLIQHACSNGGGSDRLASPVSSAITGVNPAQQFENTLNKKLACCMNESIRPDITGAFIKFDCAENPSVANTNNFNTLWTASDDPLDGGQSSAMVLAGPLGKYLTGFYTLDGVKCEEFSEFAQPFTPARVKKNQSGTWYKAEDTGPTITPPASFTSIFSSKSVPTTALDMKRCPIVARAAFVPTCPANPDLPAVPKTYVDPVSGIKHCSSAASIQVHVRIEQVFEIEGTPKMKTVDTVAEQRLASSISVEKIIQNKNGSSCPGGASQRGEICVYQ